ncbi:unnamed protein product [Taenia asiatica]|uniref:Tetraspanin/Peripherin n=1 Tax=Taenia asiatica TaxID=60517 RepID=A0A0R3VTD8_TAEAS|nr:unnamed protein product [Taenia asiatica]
MARSHHKDEAEAMVPESFDTPLSMSLFLWILVFATYLLTDPAIEKQHIIGIINNDTIPYPPEPEFDIQEYVSKIVAYHRPFSRAAAIISFSVCFTTLLSTIGAAVSHGYSSATVSDYIVKMLENTFDQYRSTADKEIHYLWDTIMGMFHCCGLNNGHDFPEGILIAHYSPNFCFYLADACCLRTTTGEKFDPNCNIYPGPLNSFFYIGCRKDVQKTIEDVRVQITIAMALLLLLQLWPFLLMTFLLQSGGIVVRHS